MYDELLIRANSIAEKYRKEKRYNLFKVLEVENKEVCMCRFLTDLLNPRGLHGKGNRYLKRFFADVLIREMNRDDLNAAEICEGVQVYREYLLNDGRRIDIVIKSKKIFIPIEVKIYAEDQDAQCYDYYVYAQEKDPKTQVIYLTLWGTEPSANSRTKEDASGNLHELRGDQFVCISFAEHILNWLNGLIEIEEMEKDETMKIVLEQYKEAVMEITHKMDEGLQKELVETVTESEKNFRGALALSKAVGAAKEELIRRIMNDFENAKGMDEIKKHFHLEKDNWWENCEDEVCDFFAGKELGLNYVFQRDLLPDNSLPENIQLWLRIGIEGTSVFFGLCLFELSEDYGNGKPVKEFSPEIKGGLDRIVNFDNSERKVEDWWVKYWYLPNGVERAADDRDKIPMFKPDLNEAAIRLIDDGNRKAFIEESLEVITETLNKYMKS